MLNNVVDYACLHVNNLQYVLVSTFMYFKQYLISGDELHAMDCF